VNEFIWYLKQLLPLKYDTIYGEDGKTKVAVWNMWMGRCFNVKIYTVV